jgi:hypothetical protein
MEASISGIEHSAAALYYIEHVYLCKSSSRLDHGTQFGPVRNACVAYGCRISASEVGVFFVILRDSGLNGTYNPARLKEGIL